MTDRMKKLVYTAMGVAGLVAFLAIVDIILKVPFSGHMVLDITFIVGAGLVGYMAWDTLKDAR
jgi:hypothetical protein